MNIDTCTGDLMIAIKIAKEKTLQSKKQKTTPGVSVDTSKLAKSASRKASLGSVLSMSRKDL